MVTATVAAGPNRLASRTYGLCHCPGMPPGPGPRPGGGRLGPRRQSSVHWNHLIDHDFSGHCSGHRSWHLDSVNLIRKLSTRPLVLCCAPPVRLGPSDSNALAPGSGLRLRVSRAGIRISNIMPDPYSSALFVTLSPRVSGSLKLPVRPRRCGGCGRLSRLASGMPGCPPAACPAWSRLTRCQSSSRRWARDRLGVRR